MPYLPSQINSGDLGMFASILTSMLPTVLTGKPINTLQVILGLLGPTYFHEL